MKKAKLILLDNTVFATDERIEDGDIWKRIGYYDYEINSGGTVRRISNKRIKKPCLMKLGYVTIKLHHEKNFYTFPLHRLIAAYFIENKLRKPFVNHINGIKDDNRIENLEWVTHSENMKHAFSLGLSKPHNKLKSLQKVQAEKNKKNVYQYDKNLALINEFKSVREAQKILKYSNLSIYARTNQITAKGIFSYRPLTLK